MIEIDDVGIILAKYQSGLFEATVKELNCSSAYFYKKFAFSQLAKRMDRRSFIYESLDIIQALDELKQESNYEVGHVKVPAAIMAWIGYLLRYWAYTYEISTKTIYQHVKFDELCRIYEAYHSLDIEAAIFRIAEAHNILYLSDINTRVEHYKATLLSDKKKCKK